MVKFCGICSTIMLIISIGGDYAHSREFQVVYILFKMFMFIIKLGTNFSCNKRFRKLGMLV